MIKRILALRYVCKKYDLKYKWKLTGDVGWIDLFNQEICISFFSPHFFEILYHEVGHLIADRSLGFLTKHRRASVFSRLRYGNLDVFVLLAEEATASKFAHRVLKKEDKQYLKKCWHGYTAAVAKAVDYDLLDKYVSTIAKYNKYFEEK